MRVCEHPAARHGSGWRFNMPTIRKHLQDIERKVDACLILLRVATTHDDFVYSRHNKSNLWLAAIAEAEKIANSSERSAVNFHREGEFFVLPNGVRVPRKVASETEEIGSPTTLE